MTAIIPQSALNEIIAAAQAVYPEECCGLLSGVWPGPGTWRVEHAHPARNIAAADRRRRFEVDPALHLRLQRDLRASGRAVIGHYHSHPDGAAVPSAADLAAADDPALMWLIVAVSSGRTAVGAYRLEESNLTKMDLSIIS